MCSHCTYESGDIVMPAAVRLHIRAFYLHTYRSVRNGLAMDQAVKYPLTVITVQMPKNTYILISFMLFP